MASSDERLRADAERNRRKLIHAAREVFEREGLDASLRRIAKHAGVSEPTIRRRFATREQLVAEVFQVEIAQNADLAERAASDPDAWSGLIGYIQTAAQRQLVDRGFAEMLSLTFPPSLRAERERVRAYQAITAVVERAQADGTLRQDFTAEDIPMILMAHAGVAAAAGRLAPVMSRRLLAYLTESLAAPGRAELPPAPTESETYRALLRLHATEDVARRP